jgi:ribosome maturation factor RimP
MNRLEAKKIIEDKVVAVAKVRGLEIFEVNIKKKDGTTHIEVLLDKPSGGVSLDECSQVNKEIANDEDMDGIFPDGFSIEVSSPGIDHPMKSEKDFIRAAGAEIDVYCKERVLEKLQHTGKLLNVKAGRIALEVSGEEIHIPIEKINKAKQRI